MRSIFVLILTVISFSFTAHADMHLISVSGTAEKSVEPNLMDIHIDIWGKAPTAKKAQQLASTEYQQVKKVFETFKVKKEDIRTDNYDLNPESQYDQKTQTSKVIGFKAVQTLSVTLRNISEAGNFIDALVTPSQNTNGGVGVNSIQWDTDQKAEMEMSGLAEAVKNARKKADEMTKAAGVKIKGVAHLSHGSQFYSPPVPMRAFAKTMMVNESAPSTEL